jgi:hypothetical protein
MYPVPVPVYIAALTRLQFSFFFLFITPILLLFFVRQYTHLANIRLKKTNAVLWWWHAYKRINTSIHIYMRERKSRRPDDWLYTDVRAHYLCSVYLSKLKKLLLYKEFPKGKKKYTPFYLLEIHIVSSTVYVNYERTDGKHMPKDK